MNVVGFAGYSGAGKTTLVEQVVTLLRLEGLRVSVIKHAHHEFDIDKPGKDTWRHRQAGAFEVLVASSKRMALMRELEQPGQWNLHDLVAELDRSVDWVLVEGFKASDIAKIEVWRSEQLGSADSVRYPFDPHVRAVATDQPAALPQATQLPLLDINDAPAVLAFLIQYQSLFTYQRPEP